MHWFIEELGALTAAENCCHTLHNTYTLRGAQIRDPHAWSHYLGETIDRWGDKTEVLYGMHHWPVWGNERGDRPAEQGPRRVRLHQRRDAAPGEPRLPPGRDRRAGRAARRPRPPLGAARLLRDDQPQRQGDVRQVPRLVRRQPGDAAPAAARGRRQGSTSSSWAAPTPSSRRPRAAYDEGRVPLGRRGRQPRRVRRAQNTAARELQADTLEQLGYQSEAGHLAQPLPDGRPGAAAGTCRTSRSPGPRRPTPSRR